MVMEKQLSIILCAQSLSRVQLFATPWTAAHQVSLSMGFPRQEYWNELAFPPPGDLPDPGVKPASPGKHTDKRGRGHRDPASVNNWETWVQSLGWEDPLEKEMVTHSRILAWRISWREEPGRLQFMGWQRVRHD